MHNPPVYGARVVSRDAVAVNHGTLNVLYYDAKAVAYFDQDARGLYFAVDLTPAERRTVNKWARDRGFGTTRQGYAVARADIERSAKGGYGEIAALPNPHGRGRRRSRGRSRQRNPEGGAVVFDEPGCYIDGAMGEDHAVSRMVSLLRDILTEHKGYWSGGPAMEANNLLREHDGEEWDADFAGEWLDDATEVLQSVTREGLVWDWEAGDLCLVEEAELE